MKKIVVLAFVAIIVVALGGLGAVVYLSATRIRYDIGLEPTIAVDFASDTIYFMQPAEIDNGGMLTLEVDAKVDLYNTHGELVISNRTSIQVPPGAKETFRMAFLMDRETAAKLTQKLRATVSVTGGFLGFLKMTQSQDAEFTLPFEPETIQQILDTENVMRFSEAAGIDGKVEVSPEGDEVKLKVAENAEITLSSDVKVTKTGDEVTVSIPLTFSAQTLGVSSPQEDTPTEAVLRFVQVSEELPRVQPGTYNITLSAYRTDTNALVASGSATVNVVSIPSEVSTTLNLSINLSELTGAADIRVDYTVTGPLNTSGSFTFTFDPSMLSLLG